MSEREVLKAFAEAVEKLAWEMPAPNPYTPRLIDMCILARFEINKAEKEDYSRTKEIVDKAVQEGLFTPYGTDRISNFFRSLGV